MVSSFFSKAKPIHFVVVSTALCIAFVMTKLFMVHEPFGILDVFKQVLLFGVCLFSIFIFDFLSGKNDLTKKNSFKILFFTLFFMMLPQTFLNSKILLANLFILLAMRRIISLRSKKDVKKKLFDGAFWISLATLLYFWSSLFYILILAALLLYSIADIKDWIVPLVAVIAVAIIAGGVLVLFNTDLASYVANMDMSVSFDFSSLNATNIIVAATMMFSCFIWGSVYYLKNIASKAKSYKSAYILVFIATIIALTILIIAPKKTGAEFIFLFAPLSIILSNYMDVVTEKWFKEVFIWVLILTPVVGLIL
ncbi:DUF6427 family protein [Mangrovimonas sp. TPBH4]|uniref:DUF6427 family protein n=1 Tax=Mangrovimonas sp. TPBH4 TaxID=1645914 RepID=UPI0006B68633|nr:DUF6427 family protein [Mangrovimonas sp. TPBH4]